MVIQCVCVCVGRVLNKRETDQLIAAACYMHIKRAELAKSFLNQERYENNACTVVGCVRTKWYNII